MGISHRLRKGYENSVLSLRGFEKARHLMDLNMVPSLAHTSSLVCLAYANKAQAATSPNQTPERMHTRSDTNYQLLFTKLFTPFFTSSIYKRSYTRANVSNQALTVYRKFPSMRSLFNYFGISVTLLVLP